MKNNNFNRKNEIQKQIQLYKKERERYEQELKKDPNYKIVYHNEYHHL